MRLPLCGNFNVTFFMFTPSASIYQLNIFMLKKLGYDTYMVFVTTSLEVAQQRNETRPRVLPADVVEDSWKDVQKNMAFFQGLFGGSNFLIVDNNKHLEPEQAKKKFKMLVGQGIDKFIKKPVKNKIAKKWMKQQNLVPKKDLKQMLKRS